MKKGFFAIIFLSLATTACEPSQPESPPEQSREDSKAPYPSPQTQKICQARSKVRREEIQESLRKSQRQIIRAVRFGIRPEYVARRSARKGEWGLIKSYTMSGTSSYGVECSDEPHGMRDDQPLVRAYRVYSDVFRSCETFGARGDCEIERKMSKFAVAYNRAIVSHPNYPYRDFCRLRPGQSSAEKAELTDEERRSRRDRYLAFPDLVETEKPRTFAEAVRRENIGAMARFLESDPQAINRRDPFRQSPLDWAIRYGRVDALDWLLDHGAAADGGECGYLQITPFLTALLLGEDDMAAVLLDATPEDKRPKKWDHNHIKAAAIGGNGKFLRRMLAERHTGIEGILAYGVSRFPEKTARILEEYSHKYCKSRFKGPDKQIRRFKCENPRMDYIKNHAQVLIEPT